MSSIVERINKLKKELNAVVLAHNYQIPEIQDIADFVGDSLELSRKSIEIEANYIVFCGVHFMAETASILNPNKKVILPEINAGCPMADMVTAKQLEGTLQRKNYTVVCYVNSTAEVKALSDICCTSSNAVKVVESIGEKEILFVPDKNLAAYTKKQTNSNITPWPGYCLVHNNVKRSEIVELKEKHPRAIVLAHPECTEEVLTEADHIFSTSGILKYAKESIEKEFIIVTEEGIIHTLKKASPDKIFHPVKSMLCVNMKKITLDSVLNSLEKKQHIITVDASVAEKAKKTIEAMLEVVE